MTSVYVHVHCNYDNGFPAARWHEVFLKYFCYTLALSVFSYGFTALYTTLYCNIIIIIITYWLIFILMSTAYGVLHALVVSVCKGVVGGLHGLCLMLLAAFFKATTCQFSFSSPECLTQRRAESAFLVSSYFCCVFEKQCLTKPYKRA